MTHFTLNTAALLVAMLSAAQAQDLSVVRDITRLRGEFIIRECHTLKCFGTQAIRQQLKDGTLKEPVVLDSIEACDALNFAVFPEIKCKYGTPAPK